MSAISPHILAKAIPGMDAWLDTMRTEQGYGGPVAHRWQDSLFYTGSGFDWRYEGIIFGYLRLHQVTGELRWLSKACRAGDDLRNAQLSDGRLPASSFEANPAAGGTPHEAACDLALLRLAAVLKAAGDPTWVEFLSTARRNLVEYYIQKLWDSTQCSFRNQTEDAALVPNKISTLVEAGFALTEIEGKDDLLQQYFLPALASILPAQVKHAGSPLHGAIDQSISGSHPSGRYFPYYVARCVPALLQAFQYKREQVYLDAAVDAMNFVLRSQRPNGSFPQVIYANGRQTLEPRWIAACGDILRSAQLLSAYGYSWGGIEQTQKWLLDGILPSGGIRTADGFAALESSQLRNRLPDFRDLLPVCGWVDKAFYYLAQQVQPDWQIPSFSGIKQVTLPCIFRGKVSDFLESEDCIQVSRAGKIIYSWEKGKTWAKIH